MGITESILSGIEKILLPQITEIKGDVKELKASIHSLRELMEEKFKSVEHRFQALEDKLNLDRRLTVLEEKQPKAN